MFMILLTFTHSIYMLFFMTQELVFATNNHNKRIEIQAQLDGDYVLKTLKEIGIFEDIPENENTLQGNALAKARFVKRETGLDCFADDTGLLVDALDGEPGVFSARYAGPENSSEANMAKLLRNLEGSKNRTARFKTIIALIEGEQETLFEGEVEGNICFQKRGDHGFGYDPVFIPSGFKKTFAEMSLEEKSTISHRAKAVKKLVDYLSKK